MLGLLPLDIGCQRTGLMSCLQEPFQELSTQLVSIQISASLAMVAVPWPACFSTCKEACWLLSEGCISERGRVVQGCREWPLEAYRVGGHQEEENSSHGIGQEGIDRQVIMMENFNWNFSCQ